MVGEIVRKVEISHKDGQGKKFSLDKKVMPTGNHFP